MKSKEKYIKKKETTSKSIVRVEVAFDWNWCCADGRMWIENGCASKVSCSGSLSHSDKEVYCQAKIFKRSIKFNLEWMMRAPIRPPSLAYLLPAHCEMCEYYRLDLELFNVEKWKIRFAYLRMTFTRESHISHAFFCLFRLPFHRCTQHTPTSIHHCAMMEVAIDSLIWLKSIEFSHLVAIMSYKTAPCHLASSTSNSRMDRRIRFTDFTESKLVLRRIRLHSESPEMQSIFGATLDCFTW